VPKDLLHIKLSKRQKKWRAKDRVLNCKPKKLWRKIKEDLDLCITPMTKERDLVDRL
jgi:hypothetical protein